MVAWGVDGAGVIVLVRAHQDRWDGRRLRLACAGFACVLMALVGSTTKSLAQATGGGLQIFNTAPEPVAATVEQTKPAGGDPRPTPTMTDGKLQVLDWLVSAGAGFGGKYDSNVNATAINPQKAWGANFQPILTRRAQHGDTEHTALLERRRFVLPLNRQDLPGWHACRHHPRLGDPARSYLAFPGAGRRSSGGVFV